MRGYAVLLCTLLIYVFSLNCGGSGARSFVNRDYDMASIETYEWIPSAENDKENETVLLIQGKFDEQLKARGYKRTSEPPDFLIAYHYDIKDNLGVIYYGSDYKSKEPYPFKEGTLVIEFVDPSSQAVFCLLAEPAIISKFLTTEAQERRIDYAVNKLMLELSD